MNEVLEQSDAAAIEATLRTLLTSFRQHDASALREVYAADADWTNAFGKTLSGCERIVEYLAGLFSDANFTAGKLLGQPNIQVRPLGTDVVAVKTYTQVQGQKSVDAGVLPVRHNHSLKVLQRQPDGRWLIASEIYMDARSDTTYLE